MQTLLLYCQKYQVRKIGHPQICQQLRIWEQVTIFLPTQKCLNKKLGFVSLIFSKLPLCAKMVLTTRTCRKKHSCLMKENDNLQLSQIQRSPSPLRRLLPLGRRSCPKVCSFFAILAKQKVCQSTYLNTTSLVTRSIENSHKLSCFYHAKVSQTI